MARHGSGYLVLEPTRSMHEPLSCGEHICIAQHNILRMYFTPWFSREPLAPNRTCRGAQSILPTNRVMPPRPHPYEPHVKHGPHHDLQMRLWVGNAVIPNTMYCAAGASISSSKTSGAPGSVSVYTGSGRHRGHIPSQPLIRNV